jgi:hypothetical protein
MTDMTDQAINWIKYQQALTPDKPFFVYFRARGPCTRRTMCRRSGSRAGRASSTRAGTSAARGDLARQIEARHRARGHPKLAPKPEAIPDWDSCRPTRSAVHPPGRGLRRLPGDDRPRDRPLIEAVEDDRRARQHADLLHRRRQRHQRRGRHANGMFNEMTYFNGVQEKVEDMLR